MNWIEKKEKIRNYFCTNQRKLHRRFLRYIAIAIFVLSLTTNIFHYLSWSDREAMHREAEAIKRDAEAIKHQAELSRKMLDARARIQIINTKVNWSKFTAEEKKFITQYWQIAEYDQALPIDE